jgi:hypothetical protein
MLFAAVAVSPVLCTMGAIQILGVVAAAASRLAEGTPHERAGHWLCLVALAVVGALCGFSIQYGPDAGAMCAVTLTAMTLIAIVDVGVQA